MMDYDISKCFGYIPYPGRHEDSEIRAKLASCRLRAGKPWLLQPPKKCIFDMVQYHVMDFEGPKGDTFAAFSLYCTIHNKTCPLEKVDVEFCLDSDEDQFLAVAPPPDGVEYAAPVKTHDSITFTESMEGEGLFVNYDTCGRMTCSGDNSSSAHMQILPDRGTRGGRRLSAVLLVCLPASKLDFGIVVNVTALLTVPGIFKKLWMEPYVLRNQKVQLSCMP